MTDLPPIDEIRWFEEPELVDPIRLFVSYAYVSDTQTTCGLKPAVFGNAVLDIAYEPCSPEHITGLQATIEEHTGQSGVRLLGWQQVGGL